jgi:hypothetical protein
VITRLQAHLAVECHCPLLLLLWPVPRYQVHSLVIQPNRLRENNALTVLPLVGYSFLSLPLLQNRRWLFTTGLEFLGLASYNILARLKVTGPCRPSSKIATKVKIVITFLKGENCLVLEAILLSSRESWITNHPRDPGMACLEWEQYPDNSARCN